MKKLTFFIVLMFATSLVFAEVPRVHNPSATPTVTKEQIMAWGQHHADNPSNAVLLDFEGLGDLDPISQFYNGGTSGGGFSGTNYGVYFSPNTLGLIDADAGGTGNFANEPSPNTGMFAEIGQGAPVMDVTNGFTTSFSFYYSAALPLTVNVYDGLNGTGTLLASQLLDINYNLNCTGDPTGAYCHWDLVTIPFASTAKSVTFTGSQDNYFIIDNIAFTNLNSPCSIPTLSEWGLIILALLFLAAEMVYIRRRQYSFAVIGDANLTEKNKSLFNSRSYFMILAVLLGIAMLVFTAEIILSISIPVQDIVGALVSSAILAYILQLVNAFRKE